MYTSILRSIALSSSSSENRAGEFQQYIISWSNSSVGISFHAEVVELGDLALKQTSLRIYCSGRKFLA